MASDNETSCAGDPNFAVICSFLEKFAKSCGISHPNILELQEMLENTQEVPQPLVDLHVKLLRKARKSVSGERWEKAIIKFCHSYSNQDGWEIERFGYKKARISVKLRILKMLLELQFDLNTKFKTEVNRLSADELRCQPLGRDKMGQTYWCQLDEDCNLRVYREDLDDETWEVVARDRDGLVQLISQLSSNDPFRKDSELLNEDSSSLEIEKPITDTGQAADLQEEAAAAVESPDDDDEEEFEEIDDESEDKDDDIPSHGNIEESSVAEKEQPKTEEECNVEKKDINVSKEKLAPKEECMLKTVEPKETEEKDEKPTESPEYMLKHADRTLKPADLKEEFALKSEDLKVENVLAPLNPESPEPKECLLKSEDSKEKCVLKPAEPEEEEQQQQQQQQQRQTLIPTKSKEENNIKTTESIEKTQKPDEYKGESSLKTNESKDDSQKTAESKSGKMKSLETKESEMKPVEPEDSECLSSATEAIGEHELNHAKLKKDDVPKIADLSEKHVLKTIDHVNPETTAEKVSEVKDTQNSFSSINNVPEIERHTPRLSKNDPSQDNIPQTEFIGMDLSKPSQTRVLDPPVSKNIGIDLSSKSYAEERTLQPLVKIEDMNENSTSNSSLIAEDLSDSRKRTQSNSENFDHNRFAPLTLTATDLSTKRPIDLLQPSKVTIMNSMPGFSSLPVNRLHLSGKRLHESDLMTNEAKKLRLEQTVAANCHKLKASAIGPPLSHYDSGSFDSEDSAEVGEAIEEPLMLVRGEGSGTDCNTGNPGKEGENEKNNCDSTKNDQISAGDAGKSEKCAVSSDNDNILTSKGETSEEGPEIGNQEIKTNPVSNPSNIAETDVRNSAELREDNLPKNEHFAEKEVESGNRFTLSVEKHLEESGESSDLRAKKIDVFVESVEDGCKKRVVEEIPGSEVDEIFPSDTKQIPCSNKDASKEEQFLQSPPKHSPKLWTIETICAPDGKSKDHPKTGSGITKTSGNSLLGVVSDSLYGDKYCAKFQDAESGRINPHSSSPIKRPSRWDVGGDDKPQRKVAAESDGKGSILQNNSSLAADTSEQKINKLGTANTGPLAEELNVAIAMSPAVDVSRPSKNVESRVQIAGAATHRRGEGATLDKQAETHGSGSEECQPSGLSAEEDRTSDTNANLEKSPAQGFFFGPGCLLKSPIKKTEGTNSSNTRDSVRIDLPRKGSPERLTSMSSSLSEQSNKVIGESVSDTIQMKDQGDNCSVNSARSSTVNSAKSSNITVCTTSSPSKNDSPSKVNTLHSIDTIMSSCKPKETNNFPQSTVLCVPFSAEESRTELGLCIPEKSGANGNQLQVKEACSDSQITEMELVSSESGHSEAREIKPNKNPQNIKEDTTDQLLSKVKGSEEVPLTPIFEEFSSNILGEKDNHSLAKKECSKNVTSLEKYSDFKSQVDKNAERSFTAEFSEMCLGDENKTCVQKLRSEMCPSGENISQSAQSDINKKSLGMKKLNLFSEKLEASVEKESCTIANEKGASKISNIKDTNQKQTIETSSPAEKVPNLKESATKHQQSNAVTEEKDKALADRKEKKKDGILDASDGNQDQNTGAIHEDLHNFSESAQEIESSQGKVMNLIPSLQKKIDIGTTGSKTSISSAEGIAGKIHEGTELETSKEKPHISQCEEILNTSKVQAEERVQELESNTIISPTEKGNSLHPKKHPMNEKQSAVKTDCDRQQREHPRSSPYVKCSNSLVQKPSDSKTSTNDFNQNINKFIKSEPKLDAPVISSLGVIPSTFKKSTEERNKKLEDKCANDSSTAEIPLDFGKCTETEENDAKNEAKSSLVPGKINLGSLSEASKPKPERVGSTEQDSGKLPCLQLGEKTIDTKSMNVLRVDEVKSPLSNETLEDMREMSMKSENQPILDSKIKEEKTVVLDTNAEDGTSSFVSGNKLQYLTPVKGSQYIKNLALHSEQKNENMSEQMNADSDRDNSDTNSQSIASNFGCKEETETVADASASTMKSISKFPNQNVADKTEKETGFEALGKAEALNISQAKTVCKSNTVKKKKSDVTGKTSEDKVEMKFVSISASQPQMKSTENTSSVESVHSSGDAPENEILSTSKSEATCKTMDVDGNKPQNKSLGKYSEIVSDSVSDNKTLISDDCTRVCPENKLVDTVSKNSPDLSTSMTAFLDDRIKSAKLHDLPQEAVILSISADNRDIKTGSVTLSEVKVNPVSLGSCDTKISNIATPKIEIKLRDNLEDNSDTKKIVIPVEESAAVPDNASNENVSKERIKSEVEEIHVKETEKSLPISPKDVSASKVEDTHAIIEKNPSTSVDKGKEKHLSIFDDNTKHDSDSSDDYKTKLPCLTPKKKCQLDIVASKKIEPIVPQAISDDNTNKSYSKKCEASEKVEIRSLPSVKAETKCVDLITDTVKSSMQKDDSKVSFHKKEINEAKKQNKERTDGLNLKDDVKSIITESNLLGISNSESEKQTLQKSIVSSEVNEDILKREVQQNVVQISLVAKKTKDFPCGTEKVVLKTISKPDEKVTKSDNLSERSLNIGKLAPVLGNLSSSNISSVLEKKTDSNAQEVKSATVLPENALKKNIKDTGRFINAPSDVSHITKHENSSHIVSEQVEDENLTGGIVEKDLQRQKVENVEYQKATISSKTVEESIKNSQSETEKYPSLSEGNQEVVGADVKVIETVQVDEHADKNASKVLLNKSKIQHKEESAQAVIQVLHNTRDTNLEKDTPELNVVTVDSDKSPSEKLVQNANETELSKKPLLSQNAVNSSSLPVTSQMQQNITVDKPIEVQSSSKESVKSVPSPKSPVIKTSSVSSKVKTELQNKGRRKSLESISMGIMMGKLAAKSSLQEPAANMGDGSLLEDIKIPEESAPANQNMLARPSTTACQESENALNLESNKNCLESDKLETLTNLEGNDNKASIQNPLEISQNTEEDSKVASRIKQLSQTDGIQSVTANEKKDLLPVTQKKDDHVAESEQVLDIIKKTAEKEETVSAFMHKNETSVTLKEQDVSAKLDNTTTHSVDEKVPNEDKLSTVSVSNEKLESENYKNDESKIKNTENKLNDDILFLKENQDKDPSSIKELISDASEEKESIHIIQPCEASNTLHLSDENQKPKLNKKEEDISLIEKTVVSDDTKFLSDAGDHQQENIPKIEMSLKQEVSATVSTVSKLEETRSPKVDFLDISGTELKDMQTAAEESSEEDVANDDSHYSPVNDSLVEQESDEKTASLSSQKRGQTDEEIPSGKRSRVEESLILEETGGASSSEGEQGGEPDGSSDEGESEAGAAGKQGGSITRVHRKSGRGRRGRGRGLRGRSRAQRASAGKSASPVPTGPLEDDKKEEEPITPVTPTKPKANRGKRAPKLMGLDLGVDIVLEQSRGEDDGRPGATPVRQSRRIAQMKIREEAERRKLEEMTLQQLKEEQSRRRADAHADKKELKEGKKRKKKAIESDEDFTAEDVDEEASSKKKMKKKKKRRKKKPALSFNESNPWQSSSGSSTSQEEDEEGEQTEEEEEDDEELIFKSDHEFSPESDLENDGTEVTPMRRARTAQKGLPCEDEELTDEHACQKCGKSDHPEWILLCDKCDSGWHGSCLRPALLVIPEGDWFCPPCEHTFLLENLHNNLLEFDRNWKRRENEELRRKRLAYVGISLDNVLPNMEGSGGESGAETKKETMAASATGSEVSGSESGSSSDEDSEPVYQLRQRRQTLFSYRFNEYDDLINSAIQDEMEAVKGAGNQGRGKDIATIVKAEAEAEAEAQAQAQAQAQVQVQAQTQNQDQDQPQAVAPAHVQAEGEEIESSKKVTEIPEKSEENMEEKEEPVSEEIEKEELPPVVPKHDIKDEDEEDDEFCPFKKFQIRKKHRRLNSLDISSEDDAESDEDFKGTSSEEDEDEYEGSEGESDDSEFTGRRGKGSRRRVSGPVRRSSRARITRFDKEFINDDSEDSEPPKKKSRKLWQDSESEDSDASWRRSKRSKKQVTTFKTIKTKSKKKKKKRSKRDGDSDLEVYRAKKPKIKYGGLEDDEISPTRRTRGRKINYQELAASDSEEESWGRTRKLESEDEYIANEDDEEDEEEEVLPDLGKESGNESGELIEMKKVNKMKQDKKIKLKKIVKNSPDKFSRKGKRGPKTNKKTIIDSEEDIPPCPGVQVPSENEDPTCILPGHQSVNTQTSEGEMQSSPIVNFPIGNLPKERKGRTRGQGRKQEEQKKKGKRKRKNENDSLDFTEGLAPGFQKEKGDSCLLGKQLADVQLLPAQSRIGAEISGKGGETLMQRLTASGRTVPLTLGSNPDLLPEADRAMLLQSAKGAETDPLRSLLAAPPVIPPDSDLKVGEDVPPPVGKRKGRGRGKAAAAKVADVSHYPPLQNFPQSGSGIGNTSSSSVITRMLQSQPVSGTQSFTAAATAMGHKYFGSSSGEPSLIPMQNAGRGTSSVPPYSGPPKGLSSPYRQPPPADSSNSGLGPGMGHYGSTPSARGSGIRGPPGFQQTSSMRLRNPPPTGQPHMFHTSHHPMDPSPSGGGPIIISSANAPPPPPAGSPHSTKPGTPSTSQNTSTPPPPPPYSRPGSQLPLVPPTSTTMASMMQFPSQPGDSSQPPVRHPPPPFPPSTSASHLQTSQSTPQSSSPTHQGRSPVPGNFSPYHPPPPANYHYGGYPPPPPMSAADDALPPSAFQGSPYTDHYTSSDMTANLQASDGSNSKSYDEEGGGEFGGLVSYFSSQREDDLDT